ncbi:PilZ domain-containing protein [Acidihalobacter prosperus]
MPREFEEKRDFMRMMVDCEVHCRSADGASEYQGRVKNLSARGLLFTAERELAVGERLELLIQPQGGSAAPLEASAEVARVDVVEPGRLYEIGVAFSEVR